MSGANLTKKKSKTGSSKWSAPKRNTKGGRFRPIQRDKDSKSGYAYLPVKS